MNKKILKLIVLILLIILPHKVNAYNFCTTDDTVKLNKFAANVLTNYSYYEVNGQVKFKITINNLNSNIYIYDVKKKQTYYSIGEITLDNYGPNQTVEYKIYSNLPYCKGQYLNSLYVTLPPYNRYYKDKLCEGLENYRLCQRWSNVDLTYDEFKKEMNDYLNSKNQNETINLNDYKSIYQIILDFYIKYYYIILPIIIIIGGIIIVLKKQKENNDEF